MSARAPYFLQMQSALHAAGIATPTLVIDRARLNANIDTVMGALPEGMGYRIVAKSLPSRALLEHVRARSGTDRLMVFNLPMLLELSIAMPDASLLLGKPLPVAAARACFKRLLAGAGARAANVQWLVDTPERLAQYADLAEAVGENLQVNLEIDVGLHRGGFQPGEALGAALQQVRESNRLSFAGFMGYEPHLPALPEKGGWRERALQGAWQVYRQANELAEETLGPSAMAQATRNAGGSPTYRLYRDTSIANEVSVGSALVKPTHFDTDLLAAHQPAAFIAAPVLKRMDGVQMPGLEFADPATPSPPPQPGTTLFTYGGKWMADPVDPAGLENHKVIGRSSNQEMLVGAPDLPVSVDDFVFLRPHQSEAVFLQFGDIAVYEDGAIVDTWPVFPASA
ncbi:MAG: DSD1 family PLP-dependent enzyme [Alphaproteobacteria bacterium]|jgi:D-serine deaminase-like pyridoxal phosphate-dependent protein|nr:DSD1 family PLP-dependent enzyme [Alphaproteobacteria bacterium]